MVNVINSIKEQELKENIRVKKEVQELEKRLKKALKKSKVKAPFIGGWLTTIPDCEEREIEVSRFTWKELLCEWVFARAEYHLYVDIGYKGVYVRVGCE